ncbi:MAG: outer membrane protein OmpA-like peptidoglycan-associated protein [Saprospiraceae bacterium]|jgi:outer membrane protein OmpA-like peptidoglycan-associated protein
MEQVLRLKKPTFKAKNPHKKMIRKIILFSLLLFSFLQSYAQHEGDIWYFGKNFGLDFRMGDPVLLKDGAINTHEGCATISDAEGNLLFYTDGIQVWNKNHQVMPNGTGLEGHESATQSAVIIPKPKSRSTYYIFTVDADENSMNGGLKYTEINMIADGGLGDVKFKNKPLFPSTCEKITAIANQKNFWVITHEWNSNRFVCFNVTEKGVEEVPYISEAGSKISGNTVNGAGYMKASPKGDLIAVTIYEEDRVELFDFDNSTAKVKKKLKLPAKSPSCYGVEFSPNGQMLYVGSFETGVIDQYNLGLASNKEIIKSRFEINKPTKYNLGALQLGPDGRIYTTSLHYSYIAVIINPNSSGTRTRYNQRKIKIGKNNGRLGFPTFTTVYFSPNSTKNRKLKPRPGSELLADDDSEPIEEPVIETPKPAPAPLYLTVLVKEKVYKNPEDPNSEILGLRPLDKVSLNMDTGNKNIDYQLESDGHKKLRLKLEDTYQFLASRDGYLNNDALFIPEENKENQTLEIVLEKIFKEKEIVLDNIYYDYDKANLRSQAFPELEKLLTLLDNNATIKIQLSSHTDCRGEEEYNGKLSQDRAQSVVDYLVSMGISVNRLVAKGYGEQVPAVSCDCGECSEEQHQKNRRTTFKILE